MRHAKAGDKLGVLPSHRVALLRNLTLALIEHGQIKTTTRRAKAMRWYAEHVVTLAKRGDLASRRQIVKLLGSTETNKPGHNRIRLALDKVYSDLAPRFKDRQGGYTQIFRLADPRVGDCAPMCLIQYLPGPESAKGKKAAPKEDKKKVEDKKPVKKQAKADAEDKPTKKAAAPKADKVEKADKKVSKKKDR
ncbi:50S ribosomal protein L17 [bacterium]|nr:50S ribosomal protein L17 [bacterium]